MILLCLELINEVFRIKLQIAMNFDNKRHEKFAELVRTNVPALMLFARQWGHHAAEDIVQEALMHLYQQEVWPENTVAWLFTVVRNQSNNYLRTEIRLKRRESEVVTNRNKWFVFEENNADNELQKLVTALEQLPLKFREVIVAKIWGNLTFDQIGVMTNTSTSSAHRNYQAGIELLQSTFEISRTKK